MLLNCYVASWVRLSPPRTDRFWAWSYLPRPSVVSRVSVFERDCESTVNIDPNSNPKTASQLAIDGKEHQSIAASAIPTKEPGRRWSTNPKIVMSFMSAVVLFVMAHIFLLSFVISYAPSI